MESNFKPSTTHVGKNIAKFRSLKGLKQEVLAHELGISQSRLSEIENSEVVDEVILIKIAAILNVTPEAIKSFDETHVFYNIDNKLENVEIKDNASGIHQIFNPIDKIVELYERLLASEKEKLDFIKNQQAK
jgi:Predicted transcriptional regulators